MDKEIKRLNKIVDTLEQRIALLERLVPYWHKNSIEEIRGGESKEPYINLMEKGERDKNAS